MTRVQREQREQEEGRFNFLFDDERLSSIPGLFLFSLLLLCEDSAVRARKGEREKKSVIINSLLLALISCPGAAGLRSVNSSVGIRHRSVISASPRRLIRRWEFVGSRSRPGFSFKNPGKASKQSGIIVKLRRTSFPRTLIAFSRFISFLPKCKGCSCRQQVRRVAVWTAMKTGMNQNPNTREQQELQKDTLEVSPAQILMIISAQKKVMSKIMQ
ncbi:uncharacterized protein LOC126747164 [Anthonomus grandis grandis]|uniref:uncharacterized protein LOC126747164 n=1 Tax=Anthonomus grandis grandis TaxID=2921223 RepID=UPI0021652CA0|nr:uncharacterized protein LOC126747164 [Anthonomus grandis grandis]